MDSAKTNFETMTKIVSSTKFLTNDADSSYGVTFQYRHLMRQMLTVSASVAAVLRLSLVRSRLAVHGRLTETVPVGTNLNMVGTLLLTSCATGVMKLFCVKIQRMLMSMQLV